MNVSDEQILAAIREHHAVYGYAPSERELARAVGLSLSGLYYRLTALERQGHVRHDRGRARSLVIVEPVVPA